MKVERPTKAVPAMKRESCLLARDVRIEGGGSSVLGRGSEDFEGDMLGIADF